MVQGKCADMKKDEEEKDYYIDENGFFVMTESFLKKRGFCCGNGCRHCPYENKSSKGSNSRNGRK